MAILIQLIEGHVFNQFEISSKGLTIGRSVRNDILLDDPSVSQQHAKIELKALQDGSSIAFLHDLNSTNHTYVNNKKVASTPLNHEDMINIGTQSFKFIDESQEDLSQTKAFKKSWIPGMFYLKD